MLRNGVIRTKRLSLARHLLCRSNGWEATTERRTLSGSREVFTMTIQRAKKVLRKADAVCFDVDSTVLQDEGIDQLAAFCGRGKEVSEWLVDPVIVCLASSFFQGSFLSTTVTSIAFGYV